MSILSDKSIELIMSGKNCAQAVIAVICEKYGMDTATAMSLSSGIGSGMGCGEICGAVSGAITVIGFANAKLCEDEQSAKVATSTKRKEFLSEFKAKYGELSCRKLNQGVRKTCAELVGFAVETLEKIGY